MLNCVGVLILIHEQRPKHGLVTKPHWGAAFEQIARPKQQVVEGNHPFVKLCSPKFAGQVANSSTDLKRSRTAAASAVSGDQIAVEPEAVVGTINDILD